MKPRFIRRSEEPRSFVKFAGNAPRVGQMRKAVRRSEFVRRAGTRRKSYPRQNRHIFGMRPDRERTTTIRGLGAVGDQIGRRDYLAAFSWRPPIDVNRRIAADVALPNF